MQQSHNRSNSLPGHQTQPLRRVSLIQNPNDPMLTQTKINLDNEYKYLPPVKAIHQDNNDPKWKEYKIDGKNINNRAYTSVTHHDNYLYLYGGYQVNIGIMSDFYRMNLASTQFQWEKMTPTTKDTPGGRTRHTLCTHPNQNKLFLFGGQVRPSISTNLMFCWEIDTQKWVPKKLNSTYPPDIDNHSSCLYQREQDTYLVIVGGFFGGSIGLHSNCVFMYNFDTNDWIKLFPENKIIENSGSIHAPAPRDGAGLARFQERVFFFGGSNGHERFNDLWAFHLEQKQWSYIQVRNQVIPRVRSGHSFDIYDQKLILFGGIHDITWELDDLYMFDIQTQEWALVDEDSRKDNQSQLNSKDNSPTKATSRKSKLNTQRKTIIYPKRGNSQQQNDNSPVRGGMDMSWNDYNNDTQQGRITSMNKIGLSQIKIGTSQGKIAMTLAQQHQKTLDDKKKKEQTVKKMNMLKMFEVPDQERSTFDIHSPTSEAMKNSLLVIGNPKSDLKIRPGKLTEFGKITFSRFLQPLSAMKNSISGKRPCARDGHSTILVNNNLVIFGGDRHQMSFNDIHAVDISHLKPLNQINR